MTNERKSKERIVVGMRRLRNEKKAVGTPHKTNLLPFFILPSSGNRDNL
jgi:hypothetical protein